MSSSDPVILSSCGECGTVYDKYETDECPNCEEPTKVCQECGGRILIEVEWGGYYIESIHYECEQCCRSGTAEVTPTA